MGYMKHLAIEQMQREMQDRKEMRQALYFLAFCIFLILMGSLT